jgi:hypothetical protein
MASRNRFGNGRTARYVHLLSPWCVKSLTHCITQGNEYATYTYPDGRERHTVNGREQLPPQHVPPQRIQPSPPPSPPPIQTTLPPPPPYSNISRKRDSPTSVSGRKRDSPIREHHSPIEIQLSPSPPPISHHYRSPPSTGMSPCWLPFHAR